MSAPNIEDLPATSQTVAKALREAGLDPDVRELPGSTRTAEEAARALDCPVAAIVKSLVFQCDGAPLLVLCSGANRVDTDIVAERRGTGPLVQAKPDQVRAATGQAIGGVAPVGHPEPVATIIDEALAEHAPLWAAAGTPHTLFPTTFEDLVALTGACQLRVTS